jgi:acetyl-CoA carboxylase carboxyltransferase component
MLKHISTLGLLGFAALGFVAMPASADTAVVQQGTQDIYIQGDGNATVQTTRQVNRIERSGPAGRRTESSGVVQDMYQTGTIVGDDNAVYQESNQVNVIRERARTGARGNDGRGQGARIDIRR